jgi:hypothetical protein
MHKSALQSKAYTSFIHQRDTALEVLLRNAQVRVNDQLRSVLTRILEVISFRYGAIPQESLITTRSRHAIEMMRFTMMQDAIHAAYLISDEITKLKRKAYLLSAVGEAEAILRATGKQTKVTITKHDLDKESATNASDEPIYDRVLLSLITIIDNALRSLNVARISGDDAKQAIKRVAKGFPTRRVVKKPKRALKKLTEATYKRPDFETEANIPDDEWAAMVKDYLEDFIPQYDFRSPDAVYDIQLDGETELTEYYGWEIEKSMAHDFVDSVRGGQSEAAKQEGITDFVIISVIDERTCEECCGNFGCVDFDGLTTAEVEKITEGENDVPPFHFNCRCTMAPMLDNMPDLPQSNEEEFDQWLNS